MLCVRLVLQQCLFENNVEQFTELYKMLLKIFKECILEVQWESCFWLVMVIFKIP